MTSNVLYKRQKINVFKCYLNVSRAALTYSARGYDSAVCCSKMSRDAFLSEALYEADKALEKFAAALWECACLQDGGRSRW